jgi:hypothetical protein
MEGTPLHPENHELRQVVVSLIFCAQYKRKRWHSCLDRGAPDDAIIRNTM